MADANGSNKGLGQPPEQMSTETRLLLAFLLMGAIMFLTPYFFKSQAPAPNAKKSTQAAAESTVPPTPGEAKAPTVSFTRSAAWRLSCTSSCGRRPRAPANSPDGNQVASFSEWTRKGSSTRSSTFRGR